MLFTNAKGKKLIYIYTTLEGTLALYPNAFELIDAVSNGGWSNQSIEQNLPNKPIDFHKWRLIDSHKGKYQELNRE